MERLMVLRTLFLAASLSVTSFALAPSQAYAHETPDGFVELTKKLSPAVVNISTAQTIDIGKNKPSYPKGSPLERFNDFFGGGDENRVARALGSGFVIDPTGYIVTNNHVIEKADHIEVAFPNGDTYEAKLVGRDPSIDIALLKIEAGDDVPHVNFATGDAQVGEWVIAIGNPLGYSSSVAAGIVSANHRSISMGNYDDFIQTDVAINKGNSGGPLFNMKGEVIGINTAIVSPTGYSVGLSFSIPADLAVPIIDQLREYGETRRGFLGVNVQPVGKDMAKSYGLKTAHGALIKKVTKNSPASKAGLKYGDLIVSIGGEKLDKSSQLARMIAEATIDEKLEIVYIRKKKRKTVDVTIERLKEKVKKPSEDDDITENASAKDKVLGITVEAVSDKIHTQFRLEDDVVGVRVTKVSGRSNAAGKIRKGDVIIEVNQEAVDGPSDFAEKMQEAAESGDPIVFMVSRGGVPTFYAIQPPTT